MVGINWSVSVLVEAHYFSLIVWKIKRGLKNDYGISFSIFEFELKYYYFDGYCLVIAIVWNALAFFWPKICLTSPKMHRDCSTISMLRCTLQLAWNMTNMFESKSLYWKGRHLNSPCQKYDLIWEQVSNVRKLQPIVLWVRGWFRTTFSCCSLA